MPNKPSEEILEPLISRFLIDDTAEFKDQLPEEIKAVLKIIQSVRSNIDKALPGNSEDAEQAKRKLMNSLLQFILQAFKEAQPNLPKPLSSKVDAVLDFRANLESAQKTQQTEPRTKPALRVIPPRVRELPTAAELFTVTGFIKSIWRECNPGIALSKVTSVKQIPVQTKAKLLFDPFRKYAEANNITTEEAMDDEDLHFAMAKALSQMTSIGMRNAQSFYAHASKKFRDSENLYKIFQSLPQT